MIDLVLSFTLGLLIGLSLRRRKVVIVVEEQFDLDDPEIPEDVRAQLWLHRELDVWAKKPVDEDKEDR